MPTPCTSIQYKVRKCLECQSKILDQLRININFGSTKNKYKMTDVASVILRFVIIPDLFRLFVIFIAVVVTTTVWLTRSIAFFRCTLHMERTPTSWECKLVDGSKQKKQ